MVVPGHSNVHVSSSQKLTDVLSVPRSSNAVHLLRLSMLCILHRGFNLFQEAAFALIWNHTLAESVEVNDRPNPNVCYLLSSLGHYCTIEDECGGCWLQEMIWTGMLMDMHYTLLHSVAGIVTYTPANIKGIAEFFY